MTVWVSPPAPPPLISLPADLGSDLRHGLPLGLPVAVNLRLDFAPTVSGAVSEQLVRVFYSLNGVSIDRFQTTSAPQPIAQAGPVKPGSIPPPKPNDPPLAIPPAPTGAPIDVKSDQQEYDSRNQTFTAIGNVKIVYAQSELTADRVVVNLGTRETRAEGNVVFRRGNQLVKGSVLVYNYETESGSLTNASGFFDLANLSDPNPRRLPADTASGSIFISALAGDTVGGVRRLGFTADRLILSAGQTWTGENLRVTNDPFSPPELEVLTSRATLRPLNESQNELVLESPVVGFDRVVFLPVPVDRLTLDQFRRPFSSVVSFDRQDRGGAFFQQSFDVVSNPNFNFRIAPQILLQRAFERSGGLFDRDLIGLVAEAQTDLGDSQQFNARASLSGLSDLNNNLRANLRYSRTVFEDHNLALTYAYRERLFSGSAGFQDVFNLGGLSVTSPNRLLGESGINYSYQVNTQIINATRADLDPNIIGTLGKFQSAITLGRSFEIVQGTGLPADRESGLRYSPSPVIPSLSAFVGVSGVYSFYTSGDNQGVLSGTVGLSTVIGNFSREFLDYTALSVSFTQSLIAGLSPFRFDRVADARTVTAQLLQQLYGPLRFGFSQTWNLDTGNLFDATYSLQYDRRTYAIVLRYNPNQGIGELVFRLSDFNWTEPPSPVTNVRGGIERAN